MPLRLIVQLPQRQLKVALESGDTIVGSAEDCDLRLPHPTVSRRHAAVRTTARGARVEDLGSSNGTQVDSRRIAGPTAIEAGSRLAFGSVPAWIEVVREGDLQPAVALAAPAAEPETSTRRPSEAPRRGTTLSASALEDFTLHQLPRLLERVRAQGPALELAQELGAVLYRVFPCLALEITHGRGSRRSVWFTARSSERPLDECERVERSEGELTISMTFFPPSFARAYAPMVDSALHLVALASRAAPSKSSPPSIQPPPLPAPASIEPQVRRIYRQAAQIARGDVVVLIQGESGTGKEVLARYLHAASGRPQERFVALNCAALPRDLLELELFGIEKAVATGVEERPGKFEQADAGTLFLDEIGDMALETQAKILRVLQEREVYRLGGKQPRSAKVRVLAATNRDVEILVGAGHFRGDLYHRIAGWVVDLPPLRDRRGDIANLAAHFLEQEAQRRGVAIAGISRSALDALVAWQWPGNIRELQREIARASLFLDAGELLESNHLRTAIRDGLDRPEPTLKEVLESTEQQLIQKALSLAAGDIAAAAGRLGIGRSTLYRRMKALGIQELD